MDYATERARLVRERADWAREIAKLVGRQSAGDRTIATRSALRAARRKKAHAEDSLRQLDEMERCRTQRRGGR
jgi:hypothetical protein